ncbi:hypothetical protein ARMGADRAFT_622173 [Armillaria gallica]|uniref:Uncharacterized protein n=1 Tax=Armillaria gallica TaxID=47427 RepID=A0A2H3D6G3_ARMGA|nr:hypothetical protein ARMGADRAFT_622173 [Armillaria gallica]
MWAVFGDVRRNELIFIVVDIAAGGHGSVFIEGRARKSRILERLGCGILLWHALLLGFRGCASIAATGAGNDRVQLGACYSSVLMMVNNCGDKRRPDYIPGVWAASTDAVVDEDKSRHPARSHCTALHPPCEKIWTTLVLKSAYMRLFLLSPLRKFKGSNT